MENGGKSGGTILTPNSAHDGYLSVDGKGGGYARIDDGRIDDGRIGADPLSIRPGLITRIKFPLDWKSLLCGACILDRGGFSSSSSSAPPPPLSLPLESNLSLPAERKGQRENVA